MPDDTRQQADARREQEAAARREADVRKEGDPRRNDPRNPDLRHPNDERNLDVTRNDESRLDNRQLHESRQGPGVVDAGHSAEEDERKEFYVAAGDEVTIKGRVLDAHDRGNIVVAVGQVSMLVSIADLESVHVSGGKYKTFKSDGHGGEVLVGDDGRATELKSGDVDSHDTKQRGARGELVQSGAGRTGQSVPGDAGHPPAPTPAGYDRDAPRGR